MNNNKRIALITRIEGQKDLKSLSTLLKASSDAGIQDRYIILKTDNIDIPNTVDGVRIILVPDNDPTSPVSLNAALREIERSKKKPDAFLVTSKEVGIKNEDVKVLIDELYTKRGMLVVGYKLKVEVKDRNSKVLEEQSRMLDDELQEFYEDTRLIAFRVPWNTCAIWDYGLFQKHIGKFDEITAKGNPFPPVNVSINGTNRQIPHKGMEDGLAIAKAVAANKSVLYKLLDRRLPWLVTNQNGHREKLARKDLVMRDFMALRDYSVEDLVNAQL